MSGFILVASGPTLSPSFLGTSRASSDFAGRSLPGEFGSLPASVDGDGRRVRARSVLVTSAAPSRGPEVTRGAGGRALAGFPRFAGAVRHSEVSVPRELGARRERPKQEVEEPMRSVGLEIGRPAVGSTREGQPHPLGRGGLQVGAAGAELSPKGSQGPSAEADRPVS